MSFILSSRYYLKNTPNSLEYLATNNDNYQLTIFCYMAVRVFSDCLPYKLLEHGEVLYRVRCSLVTILTGFISVWVTWSVIFKKKSIQDLYSISKFRFVIGFGVLLSFDLAITLPQFIDSKVHQFVYFFLFFVAVLPLSLMKLGHLGMQRLMYKTSNFTLDELSVYISNLIANMKTATHTSNNRHERQHAAARHNAAPLQLLPGRELLLQEVPAVRPQGQPPGGVRQEVPLITAARSPPPLS